MAEPLTEKYLCGAESTADAFEGYYVANTVRALVAEVRRLRCHQNEKGESVTVWTQKQLQDQTDVYWRRGCKTGYDRGWQHGLLVASLVTSVIWGVITALMKR